MTRLARLVKTSGRVAGTSSRRAKIAELAALLREIAPDEIGIAVAYLAGETRQGRTGIGYALLREAAAGASSEWQLMLRDVDAALEAIATTTGSGSNAARVDLLRGLLARASADEQQFLARLLLGELRQGALAGLMVDAVAAAAGLPVAEVRRAAMVGGGIAQIAAVAIGEGAAGLRRFAIALFEPVAPMLAQPAEDIDDALASISHAAIEWKLDGARVQVHKAGDAVRIFTRTGNDVTEAAPEIVAVARGLDAASAILDGEAIVLRADGSPLPFQETMARFSRLRDADATRAAMPLSVFFFDCLRCNDADVTSLSGTERFDVLSAIVPAGQRMPRLVAGDRQQAQAFYDDALRRGHEGVMVKALDAPYEPGARSASWRKVKRVHTLDLVVLAAEWGHGRRRAWLSNLHLGARDPASGSFVMLGKTFKGLTDATLAWQTAELLAREIARDAWTVQVRPELVVEIAFNDLQASSRYPGGLALRFARVKGYRPDKRAQDADTIDTVRAIYAAQGTRSAG